MGLTNKRVTDVGAPALALAVVRSTSLTNVHLRDNRVTDVGASAFKDAVAINLGGM